MKLLARLRQHWHPLHTLRNKNAFRWLINRFDPAIAISLPNLPDKVYLRLLTHAPIIVASEAHEAEIRQIFGIVANHLPANAAFWDVGANVGMMTFLFAAHRPQGRIVSFEPDPKNLICLNKSARRWKLDSHDIVEAAVSDRLGTAEFFVDDLSGATGSLEDAASSFSARHFKIKPKSITVPIITLDAFSAETAATPHVIKIDVEGAELKVLEGARQVIVQHLPVLFIETFEHREEIISFVGAHGYVCYDADHLSHVTNNTTNLFCIVPSQFPTAMLDALHKIGYQAEAQLKES